MKTLLITLSLVILSSCAFQRVKVMNASAVSMTHDSLKPGQTLVESGDVKGEFCADNLKQQGSFGLFDEAIKNAQSTNQVDFILNATFWATGNCMSVEGTGAKVASNKK
ncbi:MAG: hypothetical protein A2381_15575 [Bdellovibrionales bacterium RIFOXYB1_FULL_37_110]|nr:MAG: hypothetical protein A2417_07425 [Bdellovibrionales bacterium RIFOXYC1_FULL_37_79]OFZ57041.1 MAG: hypothetical protein A2381_15575 [Bdellovibrionales bacterium RIFOXYB1_FULL_37_110]OFZ64040.1 MAG: hypothetical protein A2577_16190 [Bdellovibrionales bacterium RIFOXYD1_FULL_36_51]